EDGLPKKIVTELTQTAQTQHVGRLPLLQVVGAALVEQLAGRQDRTLRPADVAAIGGVEGALLKYADAKVKALPVGVSEQRALRELVNSLYTRHSDGALTRNLLSTQLVTNSWKGAQPGETVQAAAQVRLLEVNRLLIDGKAGDY